MARLAFGDFVLDERTGRLTRRSVEVELRPLEYKLLLQLLADPERIHSREALMGALWPDVHVTDESLTQQVSRLRRKLGGLIGTVPRRGYRLEVPVHPEAGPELRSYGDTFVGRQAELAQLRTLLDGGARLITVKGLAGVGKTRLVTEMAAERSAQLIELAPFRRADEVVRAAAGAVGVGLGDGVDAGRVGLGLARLGPTLLILDNFEQVLDAAPVVAEWLRVAPELACIVTSRSPLGVRGERILELSPLGEADAVSLFASRASVASDEPTLAPLVHALDRLPLALELAASRSRLVPVSRMLGQLERRFEVLRARHPDRPERHASLQAALDFSWTLLEEPEQEALRCLTVFRGRASLEAAETVVGAGALDTLQALVDHSMLTVDPEGRLGMLPTVRAYVATHGPSPQAAERHADWFSAMGSRAHLHRAHTVLAAHRELVASLDDLIAAARHPGPPERAAGAAMAAWHVLRAQGPMDLGADLLSEVCAQGEPSFSVLHAAGQASALAGRIEEAQRLHQACLDQATSNAQRAIALLNLSQLAEEGGDPGRAVELAEEALSQARAAEDRYHEGTACLLLAQLHRRSGALDAAALDVEAAEAAFGDDRRVALSLAANRALVWFDRGEREAACSALAELLNQAEAQGDMLRQAQLASLLAERLIGMARSEEAVDSWRLAVSLRRELGHPVREAEALEGLAHALEAAGDSAAAERSLAATLRGGGR